MLIPVAIYFIVFSYYPLYLGIISSFMKSKMIGAPEFTGFTNYKDVLQSPLFSQSFINVLIVGIGTFIIQFILGLLIALSLNELKSKFIKTSIQSSTYLPYLLSWSVVGGMWIKLLGPTGIVNGFLQLIYGSSFKSIIFMSEPKFAREIMILTGSWKVAGYYAVLFLAAIVSIDESIYEAAAIDGASRLRQIVQIIIPSLVPTMKVITVLSSMGILRNFDQIFVMQNSIILDKIRNPLYLIYSDGIINFKVGFATAASTLVLIATFIIATIVRKLTKYDDTYIN